MYEKVYLFFSVTLLFSILYFYLDDAHFQGINFAQDKIKENIIEEELIESFSSTKIINKAIGEKKKQIKKSIEENELKIENINQSLYQRFFNRVYFSISCGCLLGFGDIHPITNSSKLIVMLQSLITVLIIIF